MAVESSAIVYRGPSELDGQPIIVVVSGIDGSSKNGKTGPMLQTWILRSDIEPHIAARNGADESICGDCPLRQTEETGGRPCYVRPSDAPLTTFRAAREGRYHDKAPSEVNVLANGRSVRVGSYGDPAAVPVSVWADLVGTGRATSYTHQWRTSPELRDLCMASVESATDAAVAQRAGWRTFRVQNPDDSAGPLANEIECPSDTRGITCFDCGLCRGGLRAKNIVITGHGNGKKLIPIEQAAIACS